MKKLVLTVLLSISVIIILSSFGCLPGRWLPPKKYIERLIGVTLPEGATFTYEDTHHGPMGDGTFFAQITFPDEEIQPFLTTIRDNGWEVLPLSKELSLVMYGGVLDGHEYAYDYADAVGLPKVENGYWFFSENPHYLMAMRVCFVHIVNSLI